MKRSACLLVLACWVAASLAFAWLLSGCATMRPTCACACLPAPDPEVARLRAAVERMRDQIRAWNEVETLEAAADAADKAVRP